MPKQQKVPVLMTIGDALIFGAIGAGLLPGISLAAAGGKQSFDACVEETVRASSDMTTLGAIRAQCRNREQPEEESSATVLPRDSSAATGAIGARLTIDRENVHKPFTLMSHRANYFLLAAHNFQGWSGQEFAKDNRLALADLKDTEAQFQLSIKMPLAVNLFDMPLDIYSGYTVRSFWQIYNSDNSSPFRETDHEPEIWLQLRPRWSLFGFTNSLNTLGINHQSNGQSGTLSRSWNRVFASFVFERGNFALALKPWFRISEDSDTDDNPEITDYLGHGEITLAYKYQGNTLRMMLRNNIESDFSRGAVELDWSFPLLSYQYIRGYLQYFSGYGESLIDYDRYVNRIGAGILVTDVL